MAQINFTIPSRRDELFETNSSYQVRETVIAAQIDNKLREAQEFFREDGPNFILDHFDTYFSVLHHGENLRPDVIYNAYKQLHKSVQDLNGTISFLLDDKESLNEEVKTKMVTVLKMLLYIYIQFVLYMEEQRNKDSDNLTKKTKKQQTKSDNFTVDKSQVLNGINNIIQREINLFWQPPIVEHDLIGLIAELCFAFLQNPSIKSEKDTTSDIFGIFGNLIKSYDYGKTFVSRLIHSIRMYEHVVHCVSEGVQLVVQQFNCDSLIHHLVKEATEWQVDEVHQDVQGARNCATFLTNLAGILPELVLPEVMYLGKYLTYQLPTLRISILNVMGEVILKVLTNHELTTQQKDLRDDILLTILRHIRDYVATVRSKVIQILTKLQKESAIPLGFQKEVLKKIIEHLSDKAVAVRKSAITCITSFLEHNPYGAYLQLKETEEKLEEKKKLLMSCESSYQAEQLALVANREVEWASFEKDLRAVVEQLVNEGVDDEDEEDEERAEGEEQQEIDFDGGVSKIRSLLHEKEFAEALRHCLKLKNYTEELLYLRSMKDDYKVKLYLAILNSIFVDKAGIDQQLRTGAGMSEEDIKKIQVIENIIKYLENTVEYLRVLDSAIAPMKTLLFAQSMTDMNEAIQFFITAFQFKIDHANDGILEMLKIMRSSEQERHTAVVEAFKKIYLVTDTNSLAEHTATIVNRLLSLLKDLTYNNLEDFESIITVWAAKGTLDNAVIDRLWQFYTQREQVSVDDARAAAEILRMAAKGRCSIITKNISVVAQIMFAESRKTNMMFLASSYRLLAVAGLEKIDIQGKNPPFRIRYNDNIFDNTLSILVGGFFLKYPYYSEAMQAGLDFIFRVSSNPIVIADNMIKQISERLKAYPKAIYLMTRMCEMLGCVAMKLLGYLDNNVYRELKRRNHLREERTKGKKDAEKAQKKKRRRETLLDISTRSDSSAGDDALVGAEAEDTDAEYILAVLENDVVTRKGVLGQHSAFILEICVNFDKYRNHLLQQAAVTALIRYMLVSSKFCEAHISKLFKILADTPHPQLKCNILIHSSDLLTRFPNIVDPWSEKIYLMLKDSSPLVRKQALFSLSNSILRSMLRANSQMFAMTICLVDEDDSITEMTKSFFKRLEQKQRNLVNFIPDMFSFLVRLEESVPQPSLRCILKFLFEISDTSKKLDTLVDRFCAKYSPDENHRLNRNITYCLSLINYDEKALKKLHENFPAYKHHMHDAEIYSTFKQILAECGKAKIGKTDLKPLVAEIEASIEAVFEISQDGQPPKRPPVVKSTKKAKRTQRKRRGARRSDSEEEDFDESTAASQRGKGKKKGAKPRSGSDDDTEQTPAPKNKRGRRQVRVDSDSD